MQSFRKAKQAKMHTQDSIEFLNEPGFIKRLFPMGIVAERSGDRFDNECAVGCPFQQLPIADAVACGEIRWTLAGNEHLVSIQFAIAPRNGWFDLRRNSSIYNRAAHTD